MIAAHEPGIVVDVEDRVAQALAEEGHRAVQAVLPFPGVAVEFVTLVLGLVGAALLYGDGAITPAISVLIAVEGLKVDAPG